MDMRGFQQYKEQSVNTMTQGELLLLLYDELVKRLTQAELALNKQSYELFEDSVQRGIDRLYEYMIYELGRAKIGRHLEPLAHVKTMAGELRESFREAQKTSGAGKQAAE